MKDQSPEPHDYGPGVRVLPAPARVYPPPATWLALGPGCSQCADLEAAGDRTDAGCSGDSGRCRRDRWWPAGSADAEPAAATGRLRGGGSDEHGGAAAGWRFEAKWDGIRAIAAVAGGAVSLRSRAGNDLTASYPELAELGELLVEHAVVLDGEIVALGRNGAPHFGTLQHRMGVTRARDVAAVRREIEVAYYVFDVLYLDGVSLLRKNYDDRRRVLEAMRLHGEYVSVPDQFPGPASAALAESDHRHLEGIVAKRANSFYEPGKRPGTWIKIKLWRTQDVVVVGWRPGGGRRAGGIGSLLLGSERTRGAGVRRPGRNRVHRRRPRFAVAAAGAVAAQDVRGRLDSAGGRCAGRRMGQTVAGRRGGVLRGHGRSPTAPGVLARGTGGHFGGRRAVGRLTADRPYAASVRSLRLSPTEPPG